MYSEESDHKEHILSVGPIRRRGKGGLSTRSAVLLLFFTFNISKLHICKNTISSELINRFKDTNNAV